MKKENMQKAIEKLRAWINSPEGKASLQRATEEAKEECDKMRKRLEISDEQLRQRITL